MKRRTFTIALLLAAGVRTMEAQERAKQHRIAIVVPVGPVASINDMGGRGWGRVFLEELRRLGDVEGKNLTVDAYSGGGRPEGYADLAHWVVAQAPELIVASTDAIARAARFHNRSPTCSRRGNTAGARDGKAAPDRDRRSRRCHQRHQRKQ